MEFGAIFLGFAAFFFLLFWIVYRRNKSSLMSGFWFNGVMASALFALLFIGLSLESPLVDLIAVAGALLVIFLMMFGIYVLIALLLLNARAMFKRERRSLANSLTLILGLALLVWVVLSFVLNFADMPLWVRALQIGFSGVLSYYLLHIWVFFTSLILCTWNRPPKHQQYIVVLGARLVDDAPSPLLARRIDKAIDFYHKQAKKTGAPPKLVMSGGQGSDEVLPEAEAMKRYAENKGIPAEHILVEDKSTNTLENMRFSRAVMDADAGGQPYQSIYATSNYHLLRSGFYAHKAGLATNGIGSKTAAYYLPTALLREYIAFLRLHLKSNIIMASILFLGGFLFTLGPNFLARLLAA